MSHFFVVAIVPGDTKPEEIETKVTELLDPYDENKEMKPYKRYLEEDSVTRMAKHYACDITNLASLVPHMEDWEGREGGLDEQGLYYWSTYNPKSKWDWWIFGGRWNDVIPDNIIEAKHVDFPLQPFAIVTPDGTWHERGRMGWFACVADEKEQDVWDTEVIKIIQEHNKDILVGLDCHI